MDKYEWLATESAPRHYPMKIISGDLWFSDGSSLYIPSKKIIRNGWGEIGSTHIVGDALKPVPVKFDISWFSYAENKFYAGAFELPFEKLLSLFNEGVEDPNSGEKVTYDKIMVGIAPEGEVSVWLAAGAITLEVATYKAKTKPVEWGTFFKNPNKSRKEYVQGVLERKLEPQQFDKLQQNGVPKGLWQTYKTQHQWTPEITGAKPLSMWLKTFNGENEYFDFSKDNNKREHRAVPKSIILNWQHSSGQKYSAKIEFNEQEILQAYQQLIKGKEENQLKLLMEIGEKYPPAVDIFLKDQKFILKLENNNTQVYKAK